jgi:hypothetical protein
MTAGWAGAGAGAEAEVEEEEDDEVEEVEEEVEEEEEGRVSPAAGGRSLACKNDVMLSTSFLVCA